MAEILQEWEATHCALLNIRKGQGTVPTMCWGLVGTAGRSHCWLWKLLLWTVHALYGNTIIW